MSKIISSDLNETKYCPLTTLLFSIFPHDEAESLSFVKKERLLRLEDLGRMQDGGFHQNKFFQGGVTSRLSSDAV